MESTTFLSAVSWPLSCPVQPRSWGILLLCQSSQAVQHLPSVPSDVQLSVLGSKTRSAVEYLSDCRLQGVPELQFVPALSCQFLGVKIEMGKSRAFGILDATLALVCNQDWLLVESGRENMVQTISVHIGPAQAMLRVLRNLLLLWTEPFLPTWLEPHFWKTTATGCDSDFFLDISSGVLLSPTGERPFSSIRMFTILMISAFSGTSSRVLSVAGRFPKSSALFLVCHLSIETEVFGTANPIHFSVQKSLIL